MHTLERTSVVEQVIDYLKEYIAANNLHCGDKMPTEAELCRVFNVGRSTVREAYRMLQALEIIEVKRGKGVFFLRLPTESHEIEVAEWFKSNGDTVCDYMELRMAIEIMAARLAYRRKNLEQILQLESFSANYISSIKSQPLGIDKAIKMTLYDEEFHYKLVAMSSNPLLIKVEKNVCECLTKYKQQVFSLECNYSRAFASHEFIINALKYGTESDFVEAITNHLNNSMLDMQKAQEILLKKAE